MLMVFKPHPLTVAQTSGKLKAATLLSLALTSLHLSVNCHQQPDVDLMNGSSGSLAEFW